MDRCGVFRLCSEQMGTIRLTQIVRLGLCECPFNRESTRTNANVYLSLNQAQANSGRVRSVAWQTERQETLPEFCVVCTEGAVEGKLGCLGGYKCYPDVIVQSDIQRLGAYFPERELWKERGQVAGRRCKVTQTYYNCVLGYTSIQMQFISPNTPYPISIDERNGTVSNFNLASHSVYIYIADKRPFLGEISAELHSTDTAAGRVSHIHPQTSTHTDVHYIQIHSLYTDTLPIHIWHIHIYI